MAEATADMPLGAKADPKGGSLYVSASAVTTIATLGVAVKAAGTTAIVGVSKDVTVAVTNRLTYTNRESRLMLAQFAGLVDNVTATDSVTVAIYKNGVVVTGLSQTISVTAGTPVQVAMSGILDMGVNDFVEMFVTNEDTSDNITITEGTLSLIG